MTVSSKVIIKIRFNRIRLFGEIWNSFLNKFMRCNPALLVQTQPIMPMVRPGHAGYLVRRVTGRDISVQENRT